MAVPALVDVTALIALGAGVTALGVLRERGPARAHYADAYRAGFWVLAWHAVGVTLRVTGLA